MANQVVGKVVADEIVKKVNDLVHFYFREISQIPRGSGDEKAIADHLVDFAKSLEASGVTFERSKHKPIENKTVHNLVIRKPGTKGYENLPPVILQGHMDMVCQKETNSAHDFTKDPIEIVVNGDKMTAKDTTLGADNGIGVACAMAILKSDEIAHPPIEALFTSDEEDGMTGAIAVDRELISGNRLINIDTELEGTFYYGCAGGINANLTIPVVMADVVDELVFYKIDISGLKGGHSGVQIHEKHANAHKLIGRTLNGLFTSLSKVNSHLNLAKIIGGDKKNVITRHAEAIVGVSTEHEALFLQEAATLADTFKHEYKDIEDTFVMTAVKETGNYDKVLSQETLNKLVSALMIIPNDVLAMHGAIEGLVETSCSIGVLSQDETAITMASFIRSFLETKKQFVVEQMRVLAELIGAEFSTDADFPNWEPNLESELMTRFKQTYSNVFNVEADLQSIHAGLECGYFAKNFPDMDMISVGPTITGAHTTEETLLISTIEQITRLLLNVLEQMDTPVTSDSAS